MPVNPANKRESLKSPIARANQLNDAQFENQQGYFPYDLSHAEYISPRFGEAVPSMHISTVPGDRHAVHDNVKTIHNQIPGNFLSTVNQYVDSFYVPLRSVFPHNYEKLIPNPTKGDDLPNSALPQVPLSAFFWQYLDSDVELFYGDLSDPYSFTPGCMTRGLLHVDYESVDSSSSDDTGIGLYVGRLTLLLTVLSRGQLLDYLGIAYDNNAVNSRWSSHLQRTIDEYFENLYAVRSHYIEELSTDRRYIKSYSLESSLNTDYIDTTRVANTYKVDNETDSELSTWRSALSDIFERGEIPYLFVPLNDAIDGNESSSDYVFWDCARRVVTTLQLIFEGSELPLNPIQAVNTSSDPWANGHFCNIGLILAYQQCIAQYYTNDSVDNIFNADLFNQALRSVMFPSVGGFSSEPTFDYNGVSTEYDYISFGGFYHALLNESRAGVLNRQYVWMTMMLLTRRTLRYGDYFSTARPNMLAVGQLSIPVGEGSTVSPIDVTKNLLMQRYLNAANYIGQGFLQYMASIHGVKPSDTGTFPRFVAHRKIVLNNQLTNNTSDSQGAQTTNLAGYADSNGFDVFIDDFGYLLSIVSFDVLPVYKSGIDNTYHLSDRFDYFNPMLQNIGDQPIRSSEILGNPNLFGKVFGYTMRNGEYKYKLSKAHGAFVNDLKGYLLSYPLSAYRDDIAQFDEFNLHISPDFIRDKPAYMDSIVKLMTGKSPANYWHFITACVNEVKSARKIQATPAVLF